MLTDKQLERYAQVIIWGLKTARRKRFKSGDAVVIRMDADALPLAESLYAALVAEKLNPIIRLNPTANMQRRFYELAKPGQLDFVAPGHVQLVRSIQGSISLLAPGSLTHLAGVDTRKIGRTMKTRRRFRQILNKREASGDFSWTLCIYPTLALARHADLSEQQYSRQVVRACFLDRKDPLAQWRSIHRRARKIKNWLTALAIERLEIESARTHLNVYPGKMRQWVGITGRNIPSFELFISPDWRRTRGVFFADQPSFRNGNYVKHVRLEFVDGRLKGVRAQQGEKFVKQQLALDPGASRLGEFSLTDKRFSRIDRFMANTLFDENFGGRSGNSHIALGSSYSNTFAGDPATLTAAKKRKLGFNDSVLHWDFVNTETKKVTAHLAGGGSRVIYEKGMFAI